VVRFFGSIRPLSSNCSSRGMRWLPPGHSTELMIFPHANSPAEAREQHVVALAMISDVADGPARANGSDAVHERVRIADAFNGGVELDPMGIFMISSIGSVSAKLMVTSAPYSRGKPSRIGILSTAMMRPAARSRAPATAMMPTGPTPKTATVPPAGMFAFSAPSAPPKPVDIMSEQ